MRDKADLKTEDYEQFYKDVFMGTSKLGTYSHFRTEGDIEFTGLLFVQERAPFDLYDKYF